MPLPKSGFKWEENPESFDLASLPIDGDRGYFFDVDLHLPQEHHNRLGAIPMVAEMKAPPGSKDELLIQDLEDKEHYVCHFRYCNFLCNKGGKLLEYTE